MTPPSPWFHLDMWAAVVRGQSGRLWCLGKIPYIAPGGYRLAALVCEYVDELDCDFVL